MSAMNALEDSLRCFATIEADERVCADDIVDAVESLLAAIRDRSAIRDPCVGEMQRTAFATTTIKQLAMLRMTMKARKTGLVTERRKALEAFASPEACRDELRERLKTIRRERETLDVESERIVQLFASVERIIRAKNGTTPSTDGERGDRKRWCRSETIDFDTSGTSASDAVC